MEKIYLFLFICLFTFSLNAQIQVTFQVDMSAEAVSADGVHVAGSFQGWDPAGTEMLDDDGDGVYSVTVPIDFAGIYQYKFVNDDQWASDGGANEGFEGGSGIGDCGIDDGFGGHNREVDIPDGAEFTNTAFIYNTCDESSIVSSTENLEALRAVKVRPNPFTNSTLISFGNPNNEIHDLQISNITGKVVAVYNEIRGTQVEVFRNELLNGIYFATLRDTKGNAVTKKLMVK